MKVLAANRRAVPPFVRLRALMLSTTFKNLALVAFITGVAFFVLAPWMGLYEDDFAYIARPAAWNIGELIKHIQWALTTMPQGRPIGWILPQVISYIGWRIGGLPVLYFAAYLVTMLNACLFYFLLKRFVGETFALFGTFGLVLFPADTTRPFLMHAFGLQTSLTFFLVASHLYFTKRRALSYLLAAGSLLTYESAFLPFLFVPLLELPWGRARLGALVRHLALCAIMILAVLVLRRVVGEARVSETLTDPFQVVYQAVAGMVIGPLVSLSTFGFRFLAPLQSAGRAVWAGSLIAAVVLIWRFSGVGGWLGARAYRQSSSEMPSETANEHSGHGVAKLPSFQYLVVGGMMVICAYAFSFTHFPPTITGGRLTSVHLAAAVGAGILFGWVCSALLYLGRRASLEWLVGTVLGLYLAGLVGFGLVIQSEFRYGWLLEQRVWTQVIERAGDAKFDDVILVENLDGVSTPYIYPFAPWTAPGMLGSLYGLGPQNRGLPSLYLVADDWREFLTDKGEWIQLDRPGDDYWPVRTELRPEKFIILRYQEGELLRVDAGLELNGKVFIPKPRTKDLLVDLPHRRLFNVLIDPTLE